MGTISPSEIIDKILEILTRKDNQDLLNFCSGNFGIENYKEYKRIINLLKDNQIIVEKVKNFYGLTAIGRKVVEIGGWEKYIEQEKSQNKEQDFIKQKEKEQLLYDTKLAKWQVKTFWPLFGIAIIGSICGIISLILQLT